MSTQADVAPRTSSSVPAPNSSSACQKYKYKPRKRVYVIYYSMYGHILKMAKAIVAGLEKAGVKAKLFQIAETLPNEVLTKMHAPPKHESIPFITADQLKEADGFIFGIPTRFGMVPAQMKTFFDSCGQLWLNAALKNKFVATFFSCGSIGGGQDTTAYSTLPFFAHHGMIYVSFGAKYKVGTGTDVHGSSAFGSGTVAGADGKRQPSEMELEMAYLQGMDFGNVVKRTDFSK